MFEFVQMQADIPNLNARRIVNYVMVFGYLKSAMFNITNKIHTCRFHTFRNDKDGHRCQLNVCTIHSNSWQIWHHNHNNIHQTKKINNDISSFSPCSHILYVQRM